MSIVIQEPDDYQISVIVVEVWDEDYATGVTPPPEPITEVDGGNATSTYDGEVDGGDASTTSFDETYDGGSAWTETFDGGDASTTEFNDTLDGGAA